MSWGIRAHIRNVMLKASLGATFNSSNDIKQGSAAMCTVEMCPYPGFSGDLDGRAAPSTVGGTTTGPGGPTPAGRAATTSTTSAGTSGSAVIHHPPPTDDTDFLAKQIKLTADKMMGTFTQLRPNSASAIIGILKSETLKNLASDLFWWTYLSRYGVIYAADETDPQAMDSFKSVLVDMFIDCDTDGSGEVDAAELSLILAALGIQLPENVCRDLINLVDDNGNGTLELDEFLQMMCVEVISDCDRATILTHIDGYRIRCAVMWNELLPPVSMDLSVRDDIAPLLCKVLSLTLTCCFQLCFKPPSNTKAIDAANKGGWKNQKPSQSSKAALLASVPTSDGFDAVFRYQVEEAMVKMFLGARKPLLSIRSKQGGRGAGGASPGMVSKFNLSNGSSVARGGNTTPIRPLSARSTPVVGTSPRRVPGASPRVPTRPNSARQPINRPGVPSAPLRFAELTKQKQKEEHAPKSQSPRTRGLQFDFGSGGTLASSIGGSTVGTESLMGTEGGLTEDGDMFELQNAESVVFTDDCGGDGMSPTFRANSGSRARRSEHYREKQDVANLAEELLQMQVTHRPHLYDSAAAMKRLTNRKMTQGAMHRTLTSLSSAMKLTASQPRKQSIAAVGQISKAGAMGSLHTEEAHIPLPPRVKGQPEPPKIEINMKACSPAFGVIFATNPPVQRLRTTQRENYAANFVANKYGDRWAVVKAKIDSDFDAQFGPNAKWRSTNRDDDDNLESLTKEETSARLIAKHTRKAQRELAEKRHETLLESQQRFAELEHTWRSFTPFLQRSNEIRADRPEELKAALEELKVELHFLIEGEAYRFLEAAKRQLVRKYTTAIHLEIRQLDRELQFRDSREKNLKVAAGDDAAMAEESAARERVLATFNKHRRY